MKICSLKFFIHERYICEIKFSKNPIGKEVIEEVQRKIEALAIPKNVSFRPVLVHAGEVSSEVKKLDYFDKIIDWTERLSAKGR